MKEYLPIGIEKLEKIVALKRGKMVVIAGRPGLGKTTFACKMMHGLAIDKNYRVGAFSLEQSAQDLAKWMLYRRAEHQSDTDFVKELSEASQNRAWIDDTPVVSAEEIRKKCLEMKAQRNGLDYVFIDYLRLIKGNENCTNRAQAVSEISRSLKTLAVELDCVVIVLTQLSREVLTREDHRPNGTDVRDKGADVELLLYRDERYFPESADKGKLEVIVAKDGTGTSNQTVLFDWETEFSI